MLGRSSQIVGVGTNTQFFPVDTRNKIVVDTETQIVSDKLDFELKTLLNLLGNDYNLIFYIK